jgi:hypothetical protein
MEPRFAEARYREYESYFRAHPHVSWDECQKQVDARLDAKPLPAGPSQAYMASLPEGEQMEALFEYSRQSGLDIPQTAAAYGIGLVADRPATLDNSGLVGTAQAEHYERTRGQVDESAMQAMLQPLCFSTSPSPALIF